MALRSDQKKEQAPGGSRASRAADKAEGKKIDLKELSKEIEQLEKDMNELRASYELFFMGADKVEPTIARDQIKSQLRRWQQEKINNTSIRFQIQQLKARMVAQENHWNRVMRAREDGRYNRDLAKVKRREQERIAKEAEVRKQGSPEAMTQAGGTGQDAEGRPISSSEIAAAKSAAVTAGKGGGAGRQGGATDMSRPSATSADDLTEPKLKKLYQTYISARKRCGEAVDLRYEEMAAALRKQVPKLMHSTGAKAVEFKVVIRGGKAVLKALPKH